MAGDGVAANGAGWKDSAGAGVNVCDVTYERGGVCSGAPGVVGVDMAIDTGMDDDEKGFELVGKVVPFTLPAGDDNSGVWLNGFVAPTWSAGVDRGAEGTKGNCGPGVDAESGVATSGVVALT